MTPDMVRHLWPLRHDHVIVQYQAAAAAQLLQGRVYVARQFEVRSNNGSRPAASASAAVAHDGECAELESNH